MVWLSAAAEAVYDARRAGIPALVAQLQDPTTHAPCLAAIEALPSRSLRLLISIYANKAKGR